MAFSEEMLSWVACPQCRGTLKYTREEVLLCVHCRICFPIEEGIPNLSLDAALPLSEEGSLIPRQAVATFVIEKGPDHGVAFHLERGTCKGVGRHLDDPNQTQVYNIDFTMSLDEETKKLILSYLSKTLGKKKVIEKAPPVSELGGYRRVADLILNDPAVTRLHAMIFFDEKGAGIIDLVSRNGTFVNGREIEASLLKPGDEVRVGETIIRFSLK